MRERKEQERKAIERMRLEEIELTRREADEKQRSDLRKRIEWCCEVRSSTSSKMILSNVE